MLSKASIKDIPSVGSDIGFREICSLLRVSAIGKDESLGMGMIWFLTDREAVSHRSNGCADGCS